MALEVAPRIAAMINNVFVGFEDAVGEPVFVPAEPEVLAGLSSGDFGGGGMMVMFSGTTRWLDTCQPA